MENGNSISETTSPGPIRLWTTPDAEQISTDTTWGAQTHPSYAGFAWYRRLYHNRKFEPRADEKSGVADSAGGQPYDLYWNGKKIGSYGAMPPTAGLVVVRPQRCLHSAGLVPNSVLALRVWKAPLSSIDPSTNGGFENVPLLGKADVLAAQAKLTYYTNDETGLPGLLIAAVVLVAGILSFLLVFSRPQAGSVSARSLPGCRLASGLENLSAFDST